MYSVFQKKRSVLHKHRNLLKNQTALDQASLVQRDHMAKEDRTPTLELICNSKMKDAVLQIMYL